MLISVCLLGMLIIASAENGDNIVLLVIPSKSSSMKKRAHQWARNGWSTQAGNSKMEGGNWDCTSTEGSTVFVCLAAHGSLPWKGSSRMAKKLDTPQPTEGPECSDDNQHNVWKQLQCMVGFYFIGLLVPESLSEEFLARNGCAATFRLTCFSWASKMSAMVELALACHPPRYHEKSEWLGPGWMPSSLVCRDLCHRLVCSGGRVGHA